MAQNQEQQQKTAILEQGNIYFCYRPKVEQHDVTGLDDVQRFYLVLSPHGKTKYRLIVVGQKQLPQVTDQNQNCWCFVESVSNKAQDIEQGLRQETYQTKTRGEREQPSARPVGEGIYEIVQHQDHTHLIYALELPQETGSAQTALRIQAEASYILSIKNPETASPQGSGLAAAQKADLPQQLQNRFTQKRFIPAEPPEFLDHAGVEFILIGATADVGSELGIELQPQKETEATAEILNNLKMRKSRHPIEPLFTGEWR
ncbi:MAG TPA: hypothetical protein ACFCUY_00065 [Xenococcaceae cyanobacterium]|jgi:hypothetical protein